MSSILVVEDDNVVSTFIKSGLTKSGHSVVITTRASEARLTLQKEIFDVVILDIGLPEISGFEFIKELRTYGYKGYILMLSSLSEPSDVISGLDAGSDDYMTKPFNLGILDAKIRAMVRRKHSDKLVLQNGDLSMDLLERSVSREGKRIELTAREFNLLEFLMRHHEKVVDRNSIARHVWGSEFDPDSNVIDVYINHLRKKIDTPYTSKLLKTVVGHGYVLSKA